MNDLTFRLPCIICENGDPYSNIVCDNCECRIEHRKETFESMVGLVMDLNNLFGSMPYSLANEVREKVDPVYKALCAIKINDPREKNE